MRVPVVVGLPDRSSDRRSAGPELGDKRIHGPYGCEDTGSVRFAAALVDVR